MKIEQVKINSGTVVIVRGCVMRGFESLAKSLCGAITPPPRLVIPMDEGETIEPIYIGADDQVIARLHEQRSYSEYPQFETHVKDAFPNVRRVLFLLPGETLEGVSKDRMRAAGWERIKT